MNLLSKNLLRKGYLFQLDGGYFLKASIYVKIEKIMDEIKKLLTVK